MKQIPGTLIVDFYNDISDESIRDFFGKQGISGNLASTLNKRYAVDVPAGKEDVYLQKFEQSELIKRVNQHYLKGSRYIPPTRKSSGDKWTNK